MHVPLVYMELLDCKFLEIDSALKKKEREMEPLECSDAITALIVHCITVAFVLLGPGCCHTSASQVVGTADASHHAQLIFVLLVEMEFCHVA